MATITFIINIQMKENNQCQDSRYKHSSKPPTRVFLCGKNPTEAVVLLGLCCPDIILLLHELSVALDVFAMKVLPHSFSGH
jgi:hypothetical protein